jgi:hypothetical protein
MTTTAGRLKDPPPPPEPASPWPALGARREASCDETRRNAKSASAFSTQMRARGPAPTSAVAVMWPRRSQPLTVEGDTRFLLANWRLVRIVFTCEFGTYNHRDFLAISNAYGCHVRKTVRKDPLPRQARAVERVHGASGRSWRAQARRAPWLATFRVDMSRVS